MKKLRISMIFFIIIILLFGLSVVSSKQTTNDTNTIEKTIQKKNVPPVNVQKQSKKSYTIDKSITVKADDIKTKASKNTTFKTEVYEGNNKVNNGTVFYKIDGKTIMDDDGKTKEIKVNDGVATLNYIFPAGFSAGKHNLTHTYLNRKKTARAEKNTIIFIEKSDVNFNLKNITTTKGNILEINSSITDEFNNPLNKRVNVLVTMDGNKVKTFKTNGSFSEKFDTLIFSSGKHNMTFSIIDDEAYNNNTQDLILTLKSNIIKSFDRYVSPESRNYKTGLNWKNTQQITTAINALQYIDNTEIANIYLDNGIYNLGNIKANTAVLKIKKLKTIKTINIIGKSPDKTIISGQSKIGLFIFNNKRLRVNIKNIKFEKAKSDFGSAIRSYNTIVNIKNCIFENNKATKYGAAIYYINPTSDKISITNSTFKHNQALYGGSINIHQKEGNIDLQLSKIKASKNKAQQGAVFYSHTPNNIEINIKKSRLVDNVATENCAGLWSFADNGKISLNVNHCILSNNNASANGGVFYNVARKQVLVNLDDVTINKNKARYGGTIYSHSKNSNLICNVHNIVAKNCLTVKNGNAAILYNKAGATVFTKVSNSIFDKNKSPIGNGSCITNLGIINVYFTVNKCKFTNNYATLGGAVYSWANLNITKVLVKNSQFTNNKARLEGGAIYSTTDYEPLFVSYENLKFNKNTAGGMGGTLYNRADLNSLIFKANNIKISNSKSVENGSAITNRAGTKLSFEMKNSIINNCDAKSSKAAVYNYAIKTAKTKIAKTNIYNNKASIGAALATIARDDVKVDIVSSKIYKNTAKDSAAIYTWSDNKNIEFNIKNSHIDENYGQKTGAIYTHARKGNIYFKTENVNFYKNSGKCGGAVSNVIDRGNLNINIQKSRFNNNYAKMGAALYNVVFDGKLNEKIVKSTITSNRGTMTSATIYNNAQKITLKHNDNVISNSGNSGKYMVNSVYPSSSNLERNSWGTKNVNWKKLLFNCPKPKTIK